MPIAYIPIQLTWCWEQFLNLINKWRSITIVDIIHQGHEDIIIFHIQNGRNGANEKDFQCYSHGAALWNSQKTLFFKKKTQYQTFLKIAFLCNFRDITSHIIANRKNTDWRGTSHWNHWISTFHVTPLYKNMQYM